MASAAEQLAASVNFGALSKAKELKKKGFSASIDPKGKLTIGFKKEW